MQLQVAIPSKPGQRLQLKTIQKIRNQKQLSQSLPNQVNDFNPLNLDGPDLKAQLSQSLPNQVNDFNRKYPGSIRH